MTPHDYFTAAAHGLIAVAMQLLVWLILDWPLWAGALFPLGFFYGRELSQEGRKTADRLMVNHGDLWQYPREALRCLWPGCWSAGNQLDFYLPAVALGLVCLIG